MKKTITSVITFVLFLNLYIALTYFWNLSNKLYLSHDPNRLWLDLALFVTSLLIVIRHAQIIEVTFVISKQSNFMLGILGLSLPFITFALQKNTSVGLLGYMLVFLFFFERYFLYRQGEKCSFGLKAIAACAWITLLLIDIGLFPPTRFVSSTFLRPILFSMISLTILIELCKTCITIPPDVSDRYDLYMLAYFSVAGVLFNYCSDHIVKSKLENIVTANIQTAELVLFLFWIVVLVRIIQSLHLAALDYQSTQLKGLDLLVLSLFYIFITTYWLLKPDQPMLFGILCILALSTSAYFTYMRISRIKKESTINLRYDNRIQSINSIVFTIIGASNAYMYFYGYNLLLFIAQIAALLFNIYHSHRLTMWVKFDLLNTDRNDLISFSPASKDELPQIAAIMDSNFGYIYEYTFNTKGQRKKTQELIYYLLSSGSRFGSFGVSHFFWINDNETNSKAGLVCLKTHHNLSIFYSIISLFAFVARLFIRMGPKTGYSVVKSVIQKQAFLEEIDISGDDESIELAYIVVDKHKRKRGLTQKVVESLRDINIKNKKLYPKKKYSFTNIVLVVRELNNNAVLSFNRAGFVPIKTVHNQQFEETSNRGPALIMECPIRET